ncbi:MAG: dihydrofolate reductase family protein [Pseudomonadota bacterium]
MNTNLGPRPFFCLTVVASSDGFIARDPSDAPQNWASKEEQRLFLQDVNAADWAIMGRKTHEAADKPERRRIVFSRNREGWQRPTQFWCDPSTMTPRDLAEAVKAVGPLSAGLILGGTAVHDWFLAHDAIDRLHLTIEPVEFGAGLPIFSDHKGGPEAVLAAAGFRKVQDDPLNAGGTRYQIWLP